MIYLAFAAFIISFIILFKCADFFVEGACGIAGVFNAPKIFVGIVLVGLATTAPEFVVSVSAAFILKSPWEMPLVPSFVMTGSLWDWQCLLRLL